MLPGHSWELETSYVFNVSLVGTNASGAHFAGFIKNNRSGDVYKLGEIFTAGADWLPMFLPDPPSAPAPAPAPAHAPAPAPAPAPCPPPLLLRSRSPCVADASGSEPAWPVCSAVMARLPLSNDCMLTSTNN